VNTEYNEKMSNKSYKKDIKIDSSYDILNDYLSNVIRPTTTGEIEVKSVNLPSRDIGNQNRVMDGLVSPSYNTRKAKKDNNTNNNRNNNTNNIESSGGNTFNINNIYIYILIIIIIIFLFI
jgi:hypothetical protein